MDITISRHRILVRRHLGGRPARPRAAVERHRVPGRARQVRRRDSRTGFPRPPAEHHSRGGYRPARRRAHGLRASTLSPSRAAPDCVGSLLVGVSFTKGLSIARNIPMVEVNHLQGHILSHFIDLPDRTLPHPDFPFLCLLVSGGHTQIVRVDSPLDMQIIGTTIDDAAGEAFDKCAKVMGLPYPGGPVIDRLAREGDPKAFHFARPPGRGVRLLVLRTEDLVSLHVARRRGPGPRLHRDATRPTSAPRCRATVVEHPARQARQGRPGVPTSATSPSPAASRPTRGCATGLSKRGANGAGAPSCPSSSSRPTTRR